MVIWVVNFFIIFLLFVIRMSCEDIRCLIVVIKFMSINGGLWWIGMLIFWNYVLLGCGWKVGGMG